MDVRRWGRYAALAVALWVGIAFADGVAANPFAVAVEAARAAGGWPPDDVRFRSGSYRFFLVMTLAEAHLVACRDGEEVAVDVELRHAPFVGWQVRRLTIGEAAPP